jgi:hypothetical protein
MNQHRATEGADPIRPITPSPRSNSDDAFPSVEYVRGKLADAELLLTYAAETGVEIDPVLTAHILAARLAETEGWSMQTVEQFIVAFTALSAKLRPVTAESLRLCADEGQVEAIMRPAKRVAFWLAVFILPFSLATFATSAISGALKQDLTTANALAVTLSNELRVPSADETASNHPPADRSETRRGAAAALERGVSQKEVIEQLQAIAATTRSACTHGKQLNFFLAFTLKAEDCNTQLDAKLPDLYEEEARRIEAYQKIRFFAQNADGLVSIAYGALGACVLPVLYALLGACAYLLRLFEEEQRTRTLSDSDGHIARFIIAGIAGGVIGLFNNLNFGQPASVSPLAIAFLVGYAVDVFFAFLEGLIQSFNRPRSGAHAVAAASVAPREERGRISRA